ncbi:VanZ family protein [Salinisphaera sp. SPP-AMP-43]|uniref:VanZ family protein n=1 Tax=Salinisphaera sp. SPP-AMP-43 TaxID=3121288 RepID=UPI003C6DEDB8
MGHPRFDHRFLWATLAAIVFIVYCSLYPFRFHAAHLGDALSALLSHRHMNQQPLAGLISNVVLYLPLGIFAVLALRPRHGRLQSVLAATLFGSVLCIAMELTQFFDWRRVTTLTDVYPNAAGTAIGALIGLAISVPARFGLGRALRREPIAAVLVALFFVYRLFPYLPTLDAGLWWYAITPVFIQPQLDLYAIARYAALWAAIAFWLSRLTAGPTRRWALPITVGIMLLARVLIVNNRLDPSEIAGIAIVLASGPLLMARSARPMAMRLFVALAGIILGAHLWPFHWQAGGDSFGWLPFAWLLHTHPEIYTRSIVEKAFVYGSLVALARLAGAPLVLAGLAVAAALGIVNVLQTHLAGQTGELSDIVIVLSMTGLFQMLVGDSISKAHTRARSGPLYRSETPAQAERQ